VNWCPQVWQETLGWGSECVEEIGVGSGFRVIIATNRMERGKVLLVQDQGGLGKYRVGAPHSHKRLGLIKGTNEWCVFC
jgi:hypothetical protein